MALFPKYYQVKSSILQKIESGQYKAQELLPSEQQLQNEYQVSRITVRKALDDLCAEGLIYKVQGKGTYVGVPSDRGVSFSTSSCLAELVSRGFDAKRVVLRAETVTCDKQTARTYDLEEGERYFLYERLYTANGTPVSFETSFYRYRYVEGIESYDFTTQSIGKILREHYYYQLWMSRETTMMAVMPDTSVSRLMEIKESVPLLRSLVRVNCVAPDGRKELVETTRLYWRTDILPAVFAE